MAKNLKDKLAILYQYYMSSRQVGHTTLMRKGTDNYEGQKCVLLHNMDAHKDLGIKLCDTVSWRSGLDKLMGSSRPLAIDNATMTVIIEQVLDQFAKDKKEIDDLRYKLSNCDEKMVRAKDEAIVRLNQELQQTEKQLHQTEKDLMKEVKERHEEHEHPYKTFFTLIFKKKS